MDEHQAKDYHDFLWKMEEWIMDGRYLLTHLVETIDQSGNSTWKKLNKAPSTRQLYQANRVVVEEHGSYHYIKNRNNGYIGPVPEDELIWILLHV